MCDINVYGAALIGDRLMWIYSHVKSIAGRGKSKCKCTEAGKRRYVWGTLWEPVVGKWRAISQLIGQRVEVDSVFFSHGNGVNSLWWYNYNFNTIYWLIQPGVIFKPNVSMLNRKQYTIWNLNPLITRVPTLDYNESGFKNSLK